MTTLHTFISNLGAIAPYAAVALFFLANFLVVWRLEVLSNKGVEGTVLGTLFMPFCSGMGNLIFALVLAKQAGNGTDVVTNCLFNNITNLTLLIGLPVLIWSMSGIARKKTKKAESEFQLGRIAIALNLVAALLFSFILWALASDGELDRADGLVLLTTFFFWQCFHIYDVRKTNLLKKKQYPKTLPLDIALLLLSAFAVYISTDWLVQWFQGLETAKLPPEILGWASGVLMVIPNALLAFYYGAKNRMDVVYISQSGDAHMCIPFCIGAFAVFHAIPAGDFLTNALYILMGLSLLHLLCITLIGRLPRFVALALIAAFAAFIWLGLT